MKQGDPLKILKSLIKSTNTNAVYWNIRFEPELFNIDEKIRSELEKSGIQVETFNDAMLFGINEIRNKQNKPYKVFTPFWRVASAKLDEQKPLTAPRQIAFIKNIGSDSLESLKLLPEKSWGNSIAKNWKPSEASAKKKLKQFLEDPVVDYEKNRNHPDLLGTSRLSPHLNFGEISVRTVLHEAQKAAIKNGPIFENGIEAFIKQLIWREFARHMLFLYPFTATKPLHERYEKFPWHKNRKLLEAWQKGETGFPMVDAGMRELWATGWMHNRVRMIVASFLVKDLLIEWQSGANWFWNTLVDADLANNSLGWQWVAGCGADAMPYFRIFNPMSQGHRFDKSGDYVRKWIPEIAKLPNKYIHQPWEAPKSLLDECKIELGKTYPNPIVDHDKARDRALEANASLKIG